MARTEAPKTNGHDRVRLLVLETDEPHPDTQDEHGSFSDILDNLFRSAGRSHDPPLEIDIDDRFVVEPKGGKVPTLDDFDGVSAVLLTGSMFDAHGDDEWIVKLMDLLRGRSERSFIRQYTSNLESRIVDKPARYLLHRHMLWSPASMPHAWQRRRARIQRRLGART